MSRMVPLRGFEPRLQG